ncbi:riboflavin-binding protein-like [Watersipora subatra]|uniref:riboflavin-binding protein-like n=1 Tax=Watersipora subatra TaxID=2589382 RepID=UPI00355AF42B
MRYFIHMLAFHVFLSASSLVAVSEEEVKTCPFVYEARPPSAEDGLRNCTWYSQYSCCKRTEVTSVFQGMLPLDTPSGMDVAKARHCRNLINYMMCYFCDPNQANWYTTTVQICQPFCADVYTYCGEAAYNGVTIADSFASGEEFCAAQMFTVVQGESGCFKFDPTVFDSSPTVAGSVLTFFLCLLSNLLV